MADITLSEILSLAEKLTPEEQRALIAHLETEARQRELAQHQTTHQDFERTLGLLVFDVGPWPAGMTLRREDEH